MRASTPAINLLKARLAEDKPGIGMLVSMPSVATTQILAAAGFDWLFFDMEHGPIDIASVHAMVTATQGTRATPIVRVPWNLHWQVKTVLDAGAMGIVFPMIRNRAEAEAAARSVRYPPRGNRGYGPFYGPARFGVAREAIGRAEEVILAGPTYLGGLALDNATANDMIRRGHRIILTGSDTLLLERGSADILGGIDRGD